MRTPSAQLLAGRGDPRGVKTAIELLSDASPPLVRDESYQLIAEEAGQDFGYDAFGSEEDNAQVMERIRAWAETP